MTLYVATCCNTLQTYSCEWRACARSNNIVELLTLSLETRGF